LSNPPLSSKNPTGSPTPAQPTPPSKEETIINGSL